MSARNKKLTRDEIRQAFADSGVRWSPILRPIDLAQLLGLGVKAIYFWLELNRFDDAARKRGKHWLIWRDRAVDLLFNGPDWHDEIKSTGSNNEQ